MILRFFLNYNLLNLLFYANKLTTILSIQDTYFLVLIL